MEQNKQLILLHQKGYGVKPIARELGMSKNTAKTYMKKSGALGASAQDILQLDDPVLEARFHSGTPSYKQARYGKIKADLGLYLKELIKTVVTRRLLWEEYRAEHPDSYVYTQF